MAGLNPFELVLLGTVLEASVFIFEIPTGIVADLVSRRLSVITGYTLIGLGLFLEGALPLFATILLAQAVWGIGYTFISGAKDAWLADEIGEEKLAAAYLRGSQLAQIAAFTGIITNVGLASLQLNIPLLVGGLGQIALALFLALFMPETGFKPVSQAQRNTFQKMAHIFKQGMLVVRERPLLSTMLGISLIYGLYSEPLDRLWEALILDNFVFPEFGRVTTVFWFGLVKAMIMIITILTTEIIKRRAAKLTHHRYVLMLAAGSAIMALGLILFGLSTTLLMALLAYMTVAIIRANLVPLYEAWINRGLPSQVRATVLSTFGQMDAIGQVIGGPAIGLVATRWGLRAAMVLSGALLTPTLALYKRADNLESGIPQEDNDHDPSE